MTVEARAGRRGSHRVPGEQAAATERTLAGTPGLVGEPSDPERARTLLAHTAHAVLATVGSGRRPPLAASGDPDTDRAMRIGFEQLTDTPDAVRAAMIALLARVRAPG